MSNSSSPSAAIAAIAYSPTKARICSPVVRGEPCACAHGWRLELGLGLGLGRIGLGLGL